MRKLLSILLVLIPLFVAAEMVQPVKWSAVEDGDSVRIKAIIDEGWHMTIFTIGENELNMDFSDSAMINMAKADVAPIRYNTCNDVMCTAPEVWEYGSERVNELTNERVSGDRSLLWIFILGFLGGLLAIFTPCVWPIIPMTVSFFLKKGGGRKDAILYGISIIVLYVGLGLLVTLLFGASALNDLSTNAIVNIFFFVLLVVFALSFFGLFEITLPDSWSTALDSKARSTGGWLSILLMAFTLVIVSFSCTGPIIGTLLVEAAGHSLLAPAVGMLGFAVALALPFSLFAMFPQWMKSAPKSGNWMTSFKVTLAFLELALSLKFLSVADMAYGWGILPRWLFIAIWIGCFAGIGIYLIRKSWVGKIIAIASFAFAAYLVPGLWGAPVKAIAAFAPPMDRRASGSEHALGDAFFNDYEEGLAYARQTGKPVIIDFTGYGCVNCRKMEAYVLDNDSVKTRLQNYVFIELFVDDKRDGIGDKNSKIQREQYGANAQPFYVQLDAYGHQIAEPMVFTTDPMEFINWLKY